MILARAFRSLVRLVAVATISIASSGCSSDAPTAPTHHAAFSQTDVRVGDGEEATNGRILSVHYTGWLYNASVANQKGAVFDSSAGGDPLVFSLGFGQVIAGWDLGVVGMKVGGTRRLVIPPSHAYGSVRNGPIPANATLLFEIELVAIEPVASSE